MSGFIKAKQTAGWRERNAMRNFVYIMSYEDAGRQLFDFVLADGSSATWDNTNGKWVN